MKNKRFKRLYKIKMKTGQIKFIRSNKINSIIEGDCLQQLKYLNRKHSVNCYIGKITRIL